MFSNKNDYSIVCFNEHWLNDICLKMIYLRNYKLVSYFCRETCEHAGVSMFVKQNIISKPIDVIVFCSKFHAEFCRIETSQLGMTVVTA